MKCHDIRCQIEGEYLIQCGCEKEKYFCHRHKENSKLVKLNCCWGWRCLRCLCKKSEKCKLLNTYIYGITFYICTECVLSMFDNFISDKKPQKCDPYEVCTNCNLETGIIYDTNHPLRSKGNGWLWSTRLENYCLCNYCIQFKCEKLLKKYYT